MDEARLDDGVVVLRPLAPGDAGAHLAGEDDDQVRWLTNSWSTADSVERFLADNRKQWADGGPRLNFGVWLRVDGNDELAGNAELNLALPGLDDGEANLSYVVFPPFRGRGLAVRAIKLMCEFMSEGRLARIAVIRVDPDNEHSIRVAERAGFEPDGISTGLSGERLLRFRHDLY